MISDNLVLRQSKNTAKDKSNYEDMYCTVGAVKAKSLLPLISEKLISMWGIGSKTVLKTLDATTHQCIISTGLL